MSRIWYGKPWEDIESTKKPYEEHQAHSDTEHSKNMKNTQHICKSLERYEKHPHFYQ